MKYYILEGNLNKEVPVDDSFQKVLEDHHTYIQKYFENGKILASGPIAGGRGGVILIRLEDNESVDDFCSNDPFAKAKIQHYRITQFDLYQIQSYAELWKQ